MKTPIYKGKIIDLSLETVTLPNGTVADLEVILHPGAAAVVPLEDDGTVIMIRQYRHAVGGYIYEIPAGKLDPGESPEDCARREVKEETGYTISELQPLLSFYTTPGFTNEVIHIFLGTGLTLGDQTLGQDEVVEVVQMPLADTMRLIQTGDIKDGKTIIGLQATYMRTER